MRADAVYRIVFLILLCGMCRFTSAGTPLTQNPKWVQVGIGSRSITYVDLRSVRRSYTYEVVDGVKQELPTVTGAVAWILSDNTNQNEGGSIYLYDAGKDIWHKTQMNAPVQILSWVYKVEVDCIHAREKALSVAMYSGHMASGKVINSQDASDSEQWSSRSSVNTCDHTVEEIACKGFPYGYIKQT
jgi:hypothetical protein